MGGKSTFKSSISGIEFPEHDRVWGKSIRATIFDLIKSDYPNFDAKECISVSELNYYREKYISKFLQTEVKELTDL